jgi:hypothetical protein
MMYEHVFLDATSHIMYAKRTSEVLRVPHGVIEEQKVIS